LVTSSLVNHAARRTYSQHAALIMTSVSTIVTNYHSPPVAKTHVTSWRNGCAVSELEDVSSELWCCKRIAMKFVTQVF